MRWAGLVLLLSGAALADDVASNACGVAGDACLTDEGASGQCVEQKFSWVDPGQTSTNTELVCVASVSASEQRALPWVGAGLAFLALCIGVATRKPQVQSLA